MYKYDFAQNQFLSEKAIIEILDNFLATEYPIYTNLKDYLKGDNPTIRKLPKVESDAPDHRIPISYARKIINTITGYMYRPGDIKYENNPTEIETIFKDNDEDLKSSELGRYVSNYGIAYELFYTAPNSTEIRWVVVEPYELIPIYDYSLEPVLRAAIRYIKKADKEILEVYYDSEIRIYERDFINNKTKLNLTKTNINVFTRVPVIVYKNNAELLGDYSCQIPLIDSYDLLFSDCINEVDRLAWAYLKVLGQLDEKALKAIKKNRIFELSKDQDVNFLIKQIPSEFMAFLKGWIKEEIHRQSHIPDFTEIKQGELSGASLDRILYDLEFICSVKEAFFKKGLVGRLRLIDTINKTTAADDIEIKMQRNKPSDRLIEAQLFNLYYGKIPDEILIKEFAKFVEDPEGAIEQMQNELSSFGDGGNNNDQQTGNADGTNQQIPE